MKNSNNYEHRDYHSTKTSYHHIKEKLPMNVSAYDIAIIGGAFTILGALIGALVGYWLSVLLAKRHAFLSACSRLLAAFAPALGQIFLAQHHGNHDRPPIASFVRDNLLAHASAVEIFRPYVSSKDSAAYQKAWEDYRKLANDSIESSVEDRMAMRQPGSVLEQNIHRILSFAKT